MKMQNIWRWDQGRLNYFSLDKIRKIASIIIELDGINLTNDEDPMRLPLQRVVELPFAPENYRVWRNYARVFKILGLASKINNRLIATEMCHSLVKTGSGFLTYDDYLHYLAKVFYYPSPAFQGYNVSTLQQFPFCAILKLLIAKLYTSGEPCISVSDVTHFLIENDVRGIEEIALYSELLKQQTHDIRTDSRQIREMLIFISQLSYLSWIDGKLFIQPEFINTLTNKELEKLTSPKINPRQENPEIEIQHIFSFVNNAEYLVNFKHPVSTEDTVFTEGRKIRISHLSTERNRKVVSYYFENTASPYLCDMCHIEVKKHYPWVQNLIEVHHILPLSSPLQIDKNGTSMQDLVGLCPNCHRATHAFYRSYLTTNNLGDFESEQHAKQIYKEAKASYVSQ
jgi:hypothetical protein